MIADWIVLQAMLLRICDGCKSLKDSSEVCSKKIEFVGNMGL